MTPVPWLLNTRFYPGARRDVVKFDVLVTTYSCFNIDVLELTCIKWQAVIVDEGHRLRNVKSKLLFALQQLSSDFRLLLTGTPLQNNTQELWSLLNFIEPGKFNDMNAFLERFGNIDDIRKVRGLSVPWSLFPWMPVAHAQQPSTPPPARSVSRTLAHHSRVFRSRRSSNCSRLLGRTCCDA